MDFALSDEQREFQDYVPPVRARGDPPRRAQARRGGEHAWEVIKEAREWGLHGHRAHAAHGRRPRRPARRDHAEELHWGCAGIALAISGSGLAAAGLAASGTPEQIAEWVPQCFGNGRRDQARRLRRDRAAGRLRREEPPDHREARRRRVGPERHQGLHHERRDRRRPRGRRHRRPGARPPRPGVVRDRPKGTPGPQPGQEGVEDRHPRLPHRRGDPRGLPDPGREPARRHGQAGPQARARPLGRVQRAALERARDLRADPADRRRLGARHRAGRVRVDAAYLDNGLRRPDRELDEARRRQAAARARSASSRCSPTSPPRSRPPAAGPARVVDGAQRHPDDRRPGLDVEAQGRRRDDVGDHAP